MKSARQSRKRSGLTKKVVFLMLFFVALKLFLVCYFLKDSGHLFASTPAEQAVVQDEPVEEIPVAVEGGSEPAEFRSLSLMVKEKEDLKRREEMVRQQEEHLNQLKAEIEKNLENLTIKEKDIGKQIKEMTSLRHSLEEEELKKLAQVFESTPPEQAGPIFDKLDVKLAAKILFRMKGRYSGKIWGYVNPEQAVLISRELSNLK